MGAPILHSLYEGIEEEGIHVENNFDIGEDNSNMLGRNDLGFAIINYR